ncbi:MAG: putative heme-binding domain-containing protein, partial [Rhodothermales bacterium]
RVYGRFGNVDTHGMANSFTPWIDGWIYACHGFANSSKVSGSDGHSLSLKSGNTFRFRPDGSRIEAYTHGLVNPFGLSFDPFGNAYVSDCHSKPVYQLIPGADYPRFKGSQPLIHGPEMIAHGHGSSAICGVAYYADDYFPSAYRDSLFICNPMLGRVHHDRLSFTGSSPRAEKQEDFIRCDDEWFRPVHAIMGPDGALYIADFYNAIIGHYEMPLDHPRRDREHGRVWRVVRKDAVPKPQPSDPTAQLQSSNLLQRTLATVNPAQALALLETEPSAQTTAHILWILARANKLDAPLIQRFATHASPLVRSHLQKIHPSHAGLADPDPFVRRAAVQALAEQPAAANLAPLLATHIDEGDTHLRHALRITLSRHLEFAEAADPLLAEAAILAKSTDAARIIVDGLALGPHKHQGLLIKHAIRHGKNETHERLVTLLRSREHKLRSIADQFGDKAPRIASLRDWAKTEITRLLSEDAPAPNWTSEHLWRLESRNCKDGQKTMLISSLPLGERYTGTLRSRDFELPPTLSFYLAGHAGHIELRNANGKTLREAKPPKNDRAEEIHWELADSAGLGHLAIIDDHNGGAYAWLAAGRFSMPGLDLPESSDPIASAAELVQRFKFAEFADALRPHAARSVVMKALLSVEPNPVASALLESMGDTSIDIFDGKSAVPALLATAPYSTQHTLLSKLAKSADGRTLLLTLAESGKINPQLLRTPQLRQALNAEGRLAPLFADLPPVDTALRETITARQKAFKAGDAKQGADVFGKYCAVCHSVGGNGGDIGPNLDGLGSRDAARVIEDILEPNLNIGPAFHTVIITRKNGESIAGLDRGDEAFHAQIAAPNGVVHRIPLAEIANRRRLAISPMPAIFANLLDQQALNDLATFLRKP